MNHGYLLLALLGLIWTLIAVILSEAKQRGASVNHFYCFGSTFAVILLFAAGSAVGSFNAIFSPQYRSAFLCFAAAALVNGSGQALCMGNLKQGGRALAYSIPQLAFLLPFGWSLVFWKEPLSWRGIAGVLLIAASILYLATRRKAADQNANLTSALEPKRLVISLAAMLLIGGGQVLMATPTRFAPESMLSAWSGGCILQATNALFFLGRSLWTGNVTRVQLKCSLVFGLLWGVCAAATYATLLPTLRMLGEIKQAGIVFPVGNSMTILLFTLFTTLHFKEKLTAAQWAAFAAIVAGIFLVKL